MLGILNNHLLAFGGDKESAVLWNIDENVENSNLIQHLPHFIMGSTVSSVMQTKATITAIDWKPDGEMFITASTDGF